MKMLKRFFRYLKYKVTYRQVGPKHTPKMHSRTAMPSRDRKVRASGYQ